MTKGCRRTTRTRRCCATRMAVDALDPAGVYFGTRNGKLFGSRDEGKSWSELADGLPAGRVGESGAYVS